MKYLLDTCVLSEFVKVTPSDSVLEWLARQPERNLFISVLALGEIQSGIARLPKSQRRTTLESWLGRDLHPRFKNRIVSISLSIALKWGTLSGDLARKGVVLPTADGLLAATALNEDLTMVTRNTRHFELAGIPLLNPWE